MKTVDDIIADSRLEARLPESSAESYTDDNMLTMLNRVFRRYIIPKVLSAREEFWVDYVDLPLVDNQARYSIPYRSIGNKVRDVYLVDLTDSQIDQENIRPLGRIEPEDIPYYVGSNRFGATRNFYIENDQIVLIPAPINSTYDLRMKYFIRPNQMVLSNRTCKIVSMEASTGTVVVDTMPDAFTDATIFDFVQYNTPHKIIDYDITGSIPDPTTTEIVFGVTALAAAVTAGLSIGDYVCLQGETPVPQLPEEMVEVLIHRFTEHVLKSGGDREAAEALMQERAEIEKAGDVLIDNRIHGKVHKLVNHSSPARRLNRVFRRSY